MDEKQKLFAQLQPLCVQLLNESIWKHYTTCGPLHDLSKLLTSVVANGHDTYLSELTDYVAFPLFLGFKNPMACSIAIETALDCLRILLNNVTHKSLSQSMFKDVLLFIPILIKTGKLSQDFSIAVAPSDELKQSGLVCLQQILEKGALPVMQDLKIEYFAQMISILLELIESERSLDLRLFSLVCLQTWLSWVNSREKVRRLFPGIASSMCKVLHQNSTVSHKLLVTALDSLRIAIRIALGDSDMMGSNEEDEWQVTAVEKITIALKKVLMLRTHEAASVKIALIYLSEDLMTKCFRSLHSHIVVLLEVLMLFIADNDPKVRDRATQAVTLAGELQSEYLFLASNGFVMLIQSLPAVIRGRDNNAKSLALQTACGYLLAFKDQLTPAIVSSVETFVPGLIDVLSLYEPRNSQIYDLGLESVVSSTNLVVVDSKVSNQLGRFWQLFSCFGSDTVIEVLLAYANSKECPQTLSIINDCCRGISMRESLLSSSLTFHAFVNIDEHQDGTWQSSQLLVSDILRFLVDSLAHHENDPVDSTSVSTCLALEGIGCGAKVLGEDFRPLLIESLYIVLEKLGDPNQLVSNAAAKALDQICVAINENSARSLVTNNIDYLVNEISYRIRYIAESPSAALVLKAIIYVSDCDIIDFLDDSLAEIYDAIDYLSFGNQKSTGLLFEILDALSDVLNGKFIRNGAPKLLEQAPAQLSSLSEFLAMHAQTKERHVEEPMSSEGWRNLKLDDFSNSEQPDVENDETAVQDEKTSVIKLTREESFAKCIVQKALQFMAVDDAFFSASVLRLVKKTLPLMANSPTELYQLVHFVWADVVQRLSSASHFVVIEALELIIVMAREAGGFVKRRIIEDLLPFVEVAVSTQIQQNVATQISSKVISKHAAREFSGTSKIKLLLSALKVLESLENYLPALSTREHIRILDLVKLIENCPSFNFSSEIQVQVDIVKKAVSCKDPDLVWLRYQLDTPTSYDPMSTFSPANRCMSLCKLVRC